MKPSGKTMLGMGRTVSQGETVFYEFLQIRQNEKEEIFYIASLAGQQETAFKLVKMNKTEAVFENPEHDFPQRIIYRLENDSTLLARIEGKSKGKDRREDFPMKRTKCD